LIQLSTSAAFKLEFEKENELKAAEVDNWIKAVLMMLLLQLILEPDAAIRVILAA
jgi:hypothetical protein